MKIEFKGIPVNKVYYLGQTPQITNGCFQVINGSEKPISFYVLDVHVSDGDKDLSINEFHLYKLPDYIEIEQESITVGENENFKFDLSFPFISEKGFNIEKVEVRVTLKANEENMKASSPMIFDLRKSK